MNSTANQASLDLTVFESANVDKAHRRVRASLGLAVVTQDTSETSVRACARTTCTEWVANKSVELARMDKFVIQFWGAAQKARTFVDWPVS